MGTPTIIKFSSLVAIAFFSTSWMLFGNCQVKTYSEADIDRYIEQLKDEGWQERSQAADELGKLGGELDVRSKVIVALIEALKDKDEVVRLRATFAVANIGLPAVPDLIAELDEEREEVRASVIFALRQIGLPAIPMLTKALRNENRLVRANAATAIGEMVIYRGRRVKGSWDRENIQSWVNTASLAIPMLTELLKNEKPLVRANAAKAIEKIAEEFQERVEVLSLSELQQIIIKLEGTQEVIDKEVRSKLEAEIEKGVKFTNIESYRFYVRIEYILNISRFLNALKDNRSNRILGLALKVILILIVGPLSIVAIGIWVRPELGLRVIRTILRARKKREMINQRLPKVRKFFKQAGAKISRDRKYSLRVTSISGRINYYTPLLVMVTTEQPIEQDLTELVQNSARLARNRPRRAGIIIYGEPPDDIFFMQMRLRDRFFVIPIALAAVEKSLREDAASGLLADYAEHYLPGTDLFDDRNAIGDRGSFFGRVELLNRLEENLRRHQGIGLFGLRKSGKTSVLLQLGLAMSQHPVVHVDLQPYGGKLRYGAELFNQIEQQLSQLANKSDSFMFAGDLPASEITAEFVGRVSKLVKSLEKAGYQLPILCLLDEIERILPRETDPRERAAEFNAFFGALRALSQEQRLLSLLVADVHPDCNRINHWSQPGVPTNPVYSFFKEVFVFPFSPEDTKKMIQKTGEMMELKFDAETLAAIHRESGGHPFIARQLASLLYQKLAKEKNQQIQWSAARRYVTNPFTYSGVLKDYFKESIWADLKKRNFTSAIAILRLLACNEAEGLADRVLLPRLAREFTESESIDALLWLEAVGLVSRQESDEGDRYQIEVQLMSRWLRMQMKESEIRQWQIL